MSAKPSLFLAAVFSSITAGDAIASPRKDCETAISALGFPLTGYVFEKRGFFSMEKHHIGGVTCYININDEIDSLYIGEELLAEDGYFGREALRERDRIKKQAKGEIDAARAVRDGNIEEAKSVFDNLKEAIEKRTEDELAAARKASDPFLNSMPINSATDAQTPVEEIPSGTQDEIATEEQRVAVGKPLVEQSEAREKSDTSEPAPCEQGTPVSGSFYIQGSGINFRTGPGTNHSLVINRRATEVFRRTQYRTLSRALVLEGRCETADWLQASIVKADGDPVKWETGWVHKQFVTADVPDEIKAGLLWDIDDESDFTDTEKQVVKRGALKVLKDERNCAEVIIGYRSNSRKGAYFVTCNARNGGEDFNVWFTPDAVQNGGTLAIPEAYPETQSRQACEGAIKAQVSHPSTLDIHHFLGYATEVHNNGNRTVVQEFSAKNGFGLKLEYRARCLIQPDGTLEITISEAK